jgi:hypothetical protein
MCAYQLLIVYEKKATWPSRVRSLQQLKGIILPEKPDMAYLRME